MTCELGEPVEIEGGQFTTAVFAGKIVALFTHARYHSYFSRHLSPDEAEGVARALIRAASRSREMASVPTEIA